MSVNETNMGVCNALIVTDEASVVCVIRVGEVYALTDVTLADTEVGCNVVDSDIGVSVLIVMTGILVVETECITTVVSTLFVALVCVTEVSGFIVVTMSDDPSVSVTEIVLGAAVTLTDVASVFEAAMTVNILIGVTCA